MSEPLRLRARTRPLLGVSGIVLFVCMFLPATRVCGKPAFPLDTPLVVPPYLIGLALAICAIARTRAALAVGVWLFRISVLVVTIATIVWLVAEPATGVMAFTVAATVQCLLGVKRIAEQRIAITTIVVGFLLSAWFWLLASPPDGMIGGELSFGASIALLIAGALWTADARPPPPPPELPRAIVAR